MCRCIDMEIHQFTKKDCKKSIWLKEQVDLDALGAQVHDTQTTEGLATLASFECVGRAEDEG